MRLYAATGDAVVRLEEGDGGGWRAQRSLEGSGAHCLAVDPREPDTVFAGLREGGVRRTEDGGRTWVDCGLPAAQVFSVAVSAADGAVYAGTEPSALYRSDDRGETWRELASLLELPSRPTWSFPPRPWTSHVRWIAPSLHDPALLLVRIELGGLMLPDDGGRTWLDHRPGAQARPPREGDAADREALSSGEAHGARFRLLPHPTLLSDPHLLRDDTLPRQRTLEIPPHELRELDL